ncbi:2-iminobutanoate/2-iminopropanoate deaminase [Merluccius polli]|uniref:2-iminobutanoate/2-iminopropanoate deaminase n=1 Tax=Merluccius polli TaxID=89951 RepID=A0AA47MFV8_MERPO|nr:2-iminobutanoate/2-iminopropanoate deaminase [Merluccius polli]
MAWGGGDHTRSDGMGRRRPHQEQTYGQPGERRRRNSLPELSGDEEYWTLVGCLLSFFSRILCLAPDMTSSRFINTFMTTMAALVRRIINTTSAPAAIGPYSQAVVVDRTMYISGQLGMDPASGQLVEGGVQAQTKQALVNMGEILKAATCSYDNVVKTTVLLADMNDFTKVNDVYKQFFSSSFPARAAYQVAALPRGGLVEIEAVAGVGPSDRRLLMGP